jgi:hypothetical protein
MENVPAKTLEIAFFDPYAFVFNIGLSLNRYAETDGEYSWYLRELDFGLLILSIRFQWATNIEKVEN